uniref:DNA mismatch repair protein MutS-like N-terminal domain-containing protein n=1 Tax=Globisporangium ultimum (strain ATCC 200006 / CBS 805.95 / DAOM BR144) TaxID=431595 RepID=K3WE37_GLOUD
MQQIAGRTSTYFAARSATPATTDAYAAISNVRARKRTRQQQKASARDEVPAAATTGLSNNDATKQQLTEMEKQVVAIRAQHPDMLLLFECGYRMRMFADDAENASAVLGIRVHSYKSFRQASVPVFRTLHHCRKLVDAGYKVGIAKQTETVAMHAHTSSTSAGTIRRPLLQRSVVDVYTRATIPLPEPVNQYEDADDTEAEPELEPPTRFILSLVEETDHHTTFFKHKLHEVSHSTCSASKQADEVTIGIFAHDVHIGESIYEEFHDDATRKHLRELLDLVRPIELVLPVGKLSAYTEQLLHSYANQREEIAQDQGDRQQQQQEKRIRIERLENGHFDWHDARTRFTTFFDAAEREYSNFSTRPTLPALSTCCFGGMWAYLRALQLEKTLVSAKYSRALAASTPSTQRFKLPSESLHDLDVFRNAVSLVISLAALSVSEFEIMCLL